MDTLKLPITFERGRAALLQEGTRPYYSQIIALACRIERGELPLEITYGTKDPTFSQLRESEIRYTVAQFWPEIQLTLVARDRPQATGEQRILVDFVVGGQ